MVKTVKVVKTNGMRIVSGALRLGPPHLFCKILNIKSVTPVFKTSPPQLLGVGDTMIDVQSFHA